MSDSRTLGSTCEVEAVSCGVCNADSGREIARSPDFEYLTADNEFVFVECTACGNVYLNPRPVLAELPRIYPSNYYAYHYETAINPIALRAKDFLDRAKVKQWLSHVPSKSPRCLDVGCGNGRYLDMLATLGTSTGELYGVELDAGPIEKLNAKGYRGFVGRIEDVESQLPLGTFDLIVLLQVLEHVSEPQVVMRSLSKLLAPGGVLIVETPNTTSIDVALFKHRHWGGYHTPRHWNLFNERSLRRLAADNQLHVKSIRYLPSHAFWIFSLHHWVLDGLKMPRLAKLFNPLQNIPLLCIFTGFDIVRAALGFRTSNIQLVVRRAA
ncbi:MAG: class I SAM-dependent methyltransferase [Rhodocyclaceae bacterium]|jgi:2-polyprenyl-3-methyl-5-hydroxy-6-metoxy-1,4-benzoquinol methylase|nr:class I SAM-dependent methyltransferase [Rhodocyclaceae bacterium]MCA3022707.1 class I SAM-dependent methyltransferase [Rhodocyclaceae bacterium]MCA3029427.1 class I SAM-dependent methyltransferase [Rhodocyclaceae bacterium]MCA3035382.1 class I SAM-dependent methyltransferase [Rhodocyclaceae bacterium]MCA3044582.1 class I SAM-dependent methyltransferase [Rhodocyclaceae bacterium]